MKNEQELARGKALACITRDRQRAGTQLGELLMTRFVVPVPTRAEVHVAQAAADGSTLVRLRLVVPAGVLVIEAVDSRPESPTWGESGWRFIRVVRVWLERGSVAHHVPVEALRASGFIDALAELLSAELSQQRGPRDGNG
jgi:hypothetical protein